jgi:hypothetical protein
MVDRVGGASPHWKNYVTASARFTRELLPNRSHYGPNALVWVGCAPFSIFALRTNTNPRILF